MAMAKYRIPVPSYIGRNKHGAARYIKARPGDPKDEFIHEDVPPSRKWEPLNQAAQRAMKEHLGISKPINVSKAEEASEDASKAPPAEADKDKGGKRASDKSPLS